MPEKPDSLDYMPPYVHSIPFEGDGTPRLPPNAPYPVVQVVGMYASSAATTSA
jgi:hypothetical protein